MGHDDDYVVQTLNTAAPPLPSDNVMKNNFDGYNFSQSCGWHKFHPKKLQRLNNPKWFLFFLIVFSIAQAMIINGFTNVGLSTLEKQFKLSSKQSAMIIAAKEISSMSLIATLSFYGSFGDKPKYLGVGAITTAIGSLLYVLPHALVGAHIPDGVSGIVIKQEVCSDRLLFNLTVSNAVSEARCELLGSSEWYYLFVFIIAKLLIGAGTAPLFTLGAAYIDENVKPKVSPAYLGVWYVSTSFGPGIGFVAGGSLLNVYVDLIQPPGVNLSPDDPRWIGAWWLGHCFGGLLILMSSCALLAYPKSMPGAKEMRLQAMREGTVQKEDVRLQGKLRDIFPATATLLKNPTFIFNTLALTSCTIISTGLGPFVVTYLKAQFGVTTMKAGIASGITLIPGTAGGIFIGSWLMKRLKGRETCQHAAKYCFIFQLFALVTVGSFLIPGCKSPVMAGVHKPYYNGSLQMNNVTSFCNKDCSCGGVQYEPLCGIDNVTYFSPCHLGCNIKVSKFEYGECSCIDPSYITPNVTRKNITQTYYGAFGGEFNYTRARRRREIPIAAVAGACDRDCKHFIPFLCGIVLLLLLNFMNAVPNKMVVMRCVPDNERAYALGIQWIVLTLLGAIPGPVLFGIFIDKSCGLWESTCHGQGNCLVYDNEQLSYSLAYVIFIFQVVSAVFYFISWKTYKDPVAGVPQENPVDDMLYSDVKKHFHDDGELSASAGTNLSSLIDSPSGSIACFSSKQLADRRSDATLTTERTALSTSSLALDSPNKISILPSM